MAPSAFEIEDGVLGLEAIWTWETNGLVINDQAAAPEWIILTANTGLLDGPDGEAPADKRSGRIGETPHAASAGGKTVVLEGEVRSMTLKGLRAMSAELRAAFAPSPVEATMTIAPHPTIDGPSGVFSARPLLPGVTMRDEQTTSYYRRSFQVNLRLSDPRVYFPSLTVDETDTAATVTNLGSAPVDPAIKVTDASGDVTVTDGTRTLTFADVPSGDLVIDFAARSATVDGDPVRLVVASSDWWNANTDGIAGGATVTVSQTGGTGVQVLFTPASW